MQPRKAEYSSQYLKDGVLKIVEELCKKCALQTLLQGDLGCISILQPHFRQRPVFFRRQFSCLNRFYCFFLDLSSCPLPIESLTMDGTRIASSVIALFLSDPLSPQSEGFSQVLYQHSDSKITTFYHCVAGVSCPNLIISGS